MVPVVYPLVQVAISEFGLSMLILFMYLTITCLLRSCGILHENKLLGNQQNAFEDPLLC